MKNILLISLLGLTTATAQQGDKKDRKGTKQIPPIPAEKIPPSPYLGIEDSMKTFEVAEGFKLEPLAHGEMVRMPVALDFDSDGRAWVVEMRNYMLDLDGTRENEPTGHIRVLEDTTGDGKLDKVTTFLDKLILPRAIAVTPDGVLYCHEDKLYFINRDGLKPVGKPQLIDPDYAKGGNAEHKANGLLRGLDNWYYNAKSNARYRRIAGKWIKESTVFRGQWGIAQDNQGRLYSNNNSNLLFGDIQRPSLHYSHPNVKMKYRSNQRIGSNAVFPIRMNPGVNRAYQKGLLDPKTGKIKNTTAASGMTIYRGNQFPEKYQGMGIVTSPCANLIKLIDIKRDSINNPSGSHPLGNKELVASTDEWFRPVNLYTAPDGSVWILDIHFGLIQHKTYLTTYLRGQYSSRGLDKPDETHGRIYRLVHNSAPLAKVPKLSSLNDTELITHLGHANGTVRDKAQLIITEKLATKPSSLAKALAESFLKSNNPLQQLHILWSLEATGNIPTEVYQAALSSKDIAVQTSAMELAYLTDAPEKLLEIVATPKSQAANSYLYALGVINTQASLEKADDVIEKFSKVPALQEAYLTGTARTKSNVILAGAHDKKLAGLLKKAGSAESLAAGKQSGEGLSGEYLKSFNRGKKVYAAAACASCHGEQGEAPAPGFPPLSPSDWVTGDPERLTKVVLNGLTGPITLNGEKFETVLPMPPNMSNPAVQKDEDLADLFNYIRNLGENKAPQITAKQVKIFRAKAAQRNEPWTEKDLKKAK